MLVRFEVENFHSVRERVSFDLLVGKTTPDNSDRFLELPSTGGMRVPKVAVIYGPNASGKSTMLRVLTFFDDFIARSFHQEVDSGILSSSFLTKDCMEGLTRFKFEFAGKFADGLPETLFVYDLALQNVGGEARNVASERLRYYVNGRPRTLFSRILNKVKFYPAFDLPKALLDVAFRQDVSVVSTLSQYNHDVSIQLASGLSKAFANLYLHKNTTDDELLRHTANRYARIPGLIGLLNDNIQRADLGIERIELEKVNDGWIFVFHHHGLDKHSVGYMESQGTKGFIRLFIHIQLALISGGIAIIDELDGDLHSLIVPEIISWFHSPIKNPFGAQLIATAHDPSIMNCLEKEEIFFTEKDSSGATSVFSLQDINVRRGADFSSKYLLGAFGAIPRVG